MARNPTPREDGRPHRPGSAVSLSLCLRTAMTPAGRLSIARTLRVLPHAVHASRPHPGTPPHPSRRARLVRLGPIILVAVVTGTAVLPVIRRRARRPRRVQCGTRAVRQCRWPARLRRAVTRTETWLLFATLVLVVLTFLTLLAVDRSAGRAPTARWPCPAAAVQPAQPDRRWQRRAAGVDSVPGRPSRLSRARRARCCTGPGAWPEEGVTGPGMSPAR
jgi:hypothetical protein